ncbi:hypothetical protein [Streptomyces sp. TP-A0356]|uniref:hypothetical protein n=1 Tax=Streptomyces sp. TP-A0356 TaxID=1359208 RepID=UPI0007C84E2D|nr:hypothetical protein [Streptomyces sp. TP-A0356]
MSPLVREVVESVVREQAPSELPLVEALGRLDEDSVVRLLNRRADHREPLGFGLAEVTAVVTPVVWIAVDEACRSGVKAMVGGVGPRLRRAVRSLLRRQPAALTTVPSLTRDQLDAVHQQVREGAVGAGMDESTSRALADCVVARLVLDPPAPQSER